MNTTTIATAPDGMTSEELTWDAARNLKQMAERMGQMRQTALTLANRLEAVAPGSNKPDPSVLEAKRHIECEIERFEVVAADLVQNARAYAEALTHQANASIEATGEVNMGSLSMVILFASMRLQSSVAGLLRVTGN